MFYLTATPRLFPKAELLSVVAAGTHTASLTSTVSAVTLPKT